jgi:hypothetical protein
MNILMSTYFLLKFNRGAVTFIRTVNINPIFPFLYLRILQIFISAIRIKLSSAEMATPLGKYKLSKSSFSSSVDGLYCRNLPVPPR